MLPLVRCCTGEKRGEWLRLCWVEAPSTALSRPRKQTEVSIKGIYLASWHVAAIGCKNNNSKCRNGKEIIIVPHSSLSIGKYDNLYNNYVQAHEGTGECAVCGSWSSLSGGREQRHTNYVSGAVGSNKRSWRGLALVNLSSPSSWSVSMVLCTWSRTSALSRSWVIALRKSILLILSA